MANINKQHFLLAGSCAVVLSVISRSSLGGIRQGIREVKEMEILRNKTHIFREISKSMHIKKVAKNIFFANSLAASVGYSCYKLLDNVANSCWLIF